MLRKILNIDDDKCIGCGQCIDVCHEGALALANGKARLLRDDYCNGSGDCVDACPVQALSIIEREAQPYNLDAVKSHLLQKAAADLLPGGYPGNVKQFARKTVSMAVDNYVDDPSSPLSELAQWPVQLKLVPVLAPYFKKANLLIAADCAAYAHGDFHRRYMRNKITLIGCPKLDGVDYADKLAEILRNNNIKSLAVVRMEVPCCAGLEQAVKEALQRSDDKIVPWHITVISTDGQVVEEL